jgi:hypothetical protein
MKSDRHTEGLCEKYMGLHLQHRNATSHNKEPIQVQVEMVSAERQNHGEL